MTLTETESLFTNGKPFLTVVEPITSDDVEIIKVLKDGLTEDNYLHVSCIPKESLKDTLPTYVMSNGTPLINLVFDTYGGYFDQSGNYIKGPHISREYRLKVDRRGLKTEQQKKEKYEKEKKIFLEEHSVDKHINRFLQEINKNLTRYVEEFNNYYREDHSNFYNLPHLRKDYWSKHLNEDSEYTELEKESQEIEDKIKELKELLQEKEMEMDSRRRAITYKKLMEHPIHPSVKESIEQELSKPKPTTKDLFFPFGI